MAVHPSDPAPSAMHTATQAAPSTPPRGAVLLGGAHGTIALARVLSRQGLKVALVTDDTPLPRFSAAIARSLGWGGASDPGAVDFLEQAARAHGLEGYLLIPASDGDVRFVAEAHERLSRTFSVLLPAWDSLQWAADKALTYQRAAELGLGIPRIYPAGTALAQAAALQYPVVLKPAMRIAPNRFTRDKAWRADDAAQFRTLFQDAAALVGAGNIVVQEYIPGGGENQFSYAGLWWHGRPVLSFAARRTRQYPLEFSYTSTFVETVDDPAVILAGEQFLHSIQHHGLCEIEFKRDPRTGELKLLDVNPRPWSWFGLADAAGMDFGAAIVALSAAEPVATMTARPGIAWMFMVRDLVVAAQLALSGKLPLGAYGASVLRTRAFASFSWRDPLPGLVELPLTIWRVIARRRATPTPELPPADPSP